MVDDALLTLSARLGQALLVRGWQLALAESCTGGWAAEAITAVPGSSQWFDRGFVTYSNAAKTEMLGVNIATLLEYGAVSRQTVVEMAEGALRHSHAQVSIAVSGIAGPDGGTSDKPVGTVWFAWAITQTKTRHACCHFTGDRQSIRAQAVVFAMEKLLAELSLEP